MKYLLLTLVTSLAFAIGSKIPKAQTSLNYFQNNGKHYLALGIKNDKGWHTYWKNPGDAGLPTKITISQDGQDLKLKMLEWPVPHRYIEQGNILAYGYGGEHTFFYELSESDLNKLKKTFKVYAKWLICKDICIPGKKEILANFKGDKFDYVKTYNFEQSKSSLIKQLNELPQAGPFPENLEIYLNKDPSGATNLSINYTYKLADYKFVGAKENLLTPFPVVPFGFKHENLFYDSSTQTLYGKMILEWDGDLQEPEIPFPKGATFDREFTFKFLYRKTPDAKPYIIEKKFSKFAPTGQKQLDDFYKSLKGKTAKTSKKSSKNIFLIMLYAFLGGLILNLMPCVLPVISIKLFGLIAHRDENQSSVLRHNLFYSFGVLSTFMIFASIVAAIKASGESIGWGFQLQSPTFVAIMVIVIFILALNMFGLFEFKTPFGSKLGNAELKKGVLGDFMSGVLTTILSTPCSAPFLGSALTYAFTTTTVNIYLTFIFIGIGLSFPFILTGIAPGLISFLPRPGLWMEKLKNFLGLTLLLTTVWLYDVLMGIVDPQNVGIYINTLITLTFFAFFFHNRVSKRSFFRIVVGIIPLFFFIYMVKQDLLKPSSNLNGSAIARNSKLNWQNWSQDKLSQTPGPVFIDFTAKWCLTCKVNKKLVFETDDFENFTKQSGLKLMIADWTKYDPEITKWLEKYEVVSVPAYFVKTKDGKIKFLGETISINKIKESLK